MPVDFLCFAAYELKKGTSIMTNRIFVTAVALSCLALLGPAGCNGGGKPGENLVECTSGEVAVAGCEAGESCYKIFQLAHCFCGVDICDATEVCEDGLCKPTGASLVECTDAEASEAGCGAQASCYVVFEHPTCFCGTEICGSNEVCSDGECIGTCTPDQADACELNETCTIVDGAPACLCFGQSCGDNQYCNALGYCENIDRLCDTYELLACDARETCAIHMGELGCLCGGVVCGATEFCDVDLTCQPIERACTSEETEICNRRGDCRVNMGIIICDCGPIVCRANEFCNDDSVCELMARSCTVTEAALCNEYETCGVALGVVYCMCGSVQCPTGTVCDETHTCVPI
jgi:hypothetical protein